MSSVKVFFIKVEFGLVDDDDDDGGEGGRTES